MSNTYQIGSRTSRPRVQTTHIISQSQDQTSAHDGTGCTIKGARSQEEVRRLQELKYSGDKVTFIAKEKEKAEKKRAEKFKRYAHIDMGRKLDDTAPTEVSSNSSLGYISSNDMNQDPIMGERNEQRAFSSESNHPFGSGNDPTKKEREQEFDEQLKRARDRLQNQYNQMKNKAE